MSSGNRAESFMCGQEWHEIRVNFVDFFLEFVLLKAPSAMFAVSGWIQKMTKKWF